MKEHVLENRGTAIHEVTKCTVRDNLNTSDCHQIGALCVGSAAEKESGQNVPGLSGKA
jgi:hypothetical protein